MSKTTKEDILIVALHLFARDGYEAACKNYTVRCICLHKMDMKLYRSAGLRESLA